MSFPYLARTTLKYKSPHATDLSFAKDETVRVTGVSPDDEDWLVGEMMDGSKKGGFPKDFVTPIEDSAAEPQTQAVEPDKEPASNTTAPAEQAVPVQETPVSPPVPVSAPAPPSPKIVPVALPPSTQSSPAPAAPAQSPTRGGPDSPSRMTMKDRLAFFAAAQNKPAPPPVKPKPAASGLTWSQRQKLRQEQETAGGATAAASTPASSVSAPETAPADAPAAREAPQTKKKDDAGLSAADAVSSISKGGSLRERMAALQGAGAFGSDAEQKPAVPVPSGKTWKRPPAPPAAETEAEDDAGGVSGPVDPAETPAGEEEDAIAAAGDEVEGGDTNETDEDKEKARRAAIAARMAKLGARGPMGMAAPAKPPKKPVKEAEVVSTPAEEQAEVSFPTVDEATGEPDRASSPPASIPIPAVPRRTAPPRRRGPGPTATAQQEMPEAEKVLESSSEGGIEPPPQVMVADEEKPLPKSEKQLESEKQDEQLGEGTSGAEGATAAGIATMPTSENELSQGELEPHPDALTSEGGGRRTAATEAYGLGDVLRGAGGSQKSEIGSSRSVPREADSPNNPKQGDRQLSEEAESVSLNPIAMVPLHPPAPAENRGGVEDGAEDDDPPPPAQRMSIVPKDEVVLKHEHDADVAAREQEDEASLASAPRRPVSTEKPLGPRPLPSPGNSPMKAAVQEERPLPVPPVGGPMVPLNDQELEDRNLEGDGDEEDAYAEEEEENEEEEEEAPAPPPPRRQPSMPPPLQLGVPTPATPQRSPTSTSPIASRVVQSPPLPSSPSQPRVAAPAAPVDEASSPTAEDDEKARRSGIAARLARLGGIKFGAPPPNVKRSSMGPGAAGDVPGTPLDVAQSPIDPEPPMLSPRTEGGVVPPMSATEDETPEAEASRRRATLARLRAGGSLGYGMFNHGPASPRTEKDQRGLEASLAETPSTEQLPPVPVGRPPIPVDEETEEDAPPPPPPARPSVPAGPPVAIPTSMGSNASAPSPRPLMSPASEIPPSPQTPSVKRPPIPAYESRMSQQRPQSTASSVPEDRPTEITASQLSNRQLVDEPAVMFMNQPDFDSSPPVPAGRPPPIQTQTPESPRRSMSTVSHRSTLSNEGVPSSPASRQHSRQDTDSSRHSLSQGRPGFNELQQASKENGSRLARAARAMFDQGKKAYFGDGSSTGFVLIAMDNAHVPRPQQAWGQVVYEQEGPSVLRRYDEPRPGDIAAIHDARLKGKKGLQSYNQHVGSVEEPLVGIVAEFDAKNKHKMKVLQVERGVPEEVSYRCDDLKSGKILVYRVGV